MLHGWYCRSLANEQATQHVDVNDEDESDSDSQENEGTTPQGTDNAVVNYKSQYRYLKRKLKFLIYENEFFQDALRSNQRRLLKVSRDRAFLLDRLLQYEKPDNSSSESENTEESSDDETVKEMKRRKLDPTINGSSTSGATRGRKKKVTVAPAIESTNEQNQQRLDNHQQLTMERQMSVHSAMSDIRAPTTVPAEMFSNEPSLDSETHNEHHHQLIDVGSSPTHVAAEECVPME